MNTIKRPTAPTAKAAKNKDAVASPSELLTRYTPVRTHAPRRTSSPHLRKTTALRARTT